MKKKKKTRVNNFTAPHKKSVTSKSAGSEPRIEI
jgi:hypothetical protein